MQNVIVSQCDNKLFMKLIERGSITLISRILLTNWRIDPSLGDNWAIRRSSFFGYKWVR